MKKILIVMRHAKTETQQTGQKDYDRNLLDRGRNDAALVAARLLSAGFKPDLILTSSANRTEQTTAMVKKVAQWEHIDTTSLQKLYHADATTIEDTISSVDDSIATLMIVGHNPGISEFAYHCAPKSIISEMPTSAIAVFSIEADSWQGFSRAQKTLKLYDYPGK
ncbi:MAG TPA: histidine phosphatase family protein [Chitinophagaceae bacterium]|nr:histidine phosphatase family protein [Chitinophagaceae bacterium]